VDYKTGGFITDDYIREHFWQRIPPHITQVTAVFDCCNSGTVLDLPLRYAGQGKLGWVGGVEQKTDESKPLVVSFSGCRDPQTSASAYNLERRKQWQGAMSLSLRRVLQQGNYKVPLSQLIEGVRNELRKGGFSQIPQLAFSKEVDPTRLTTFF
jgi:hypothetical protein